MTHTVVAQRVVPTKQKLEGARRRRGMPATILPFPSHSIFRGSDEEALREQRRIIVTVAECLQVEAEDAMTGVSDPLGQSRESSHDLRVRVCRCVRMYFFTHST
jgi:hypothetical protein